MSGIFARHWVKCPLCGAVLRECDDYCPACCAPRVSSRIFNLGGRVLRFVFPPLCVAVLAFTIWFGLVLRERRLEEQQIPGSGGTPSAPPSITQSPEWQKWIHTPTR